MKVVAVGALVLLGLSSQVVADVPHAESTTVTTLAPISNRWAVVDSDGLVTNVVLWDGVTEWHPGPGLTVVNLAGSSAGPGWTYDGSTFSPPPTTSEPAESVTTAASPTAATRPAGPTTTASASTTPTSPTTTAEAANVISTATTARVSTTAPDGPTSTTWAPIAGSGRDEALRTNEYGPITSVRVSSSSGAGSFTLDAWQLDANPSSDQREAQLQDPQLFLPTGSETPGSLSGAKAGSRVEVWLFSEPKLLVSAKVTQAGLLNFRIPIPEDVPSGSHTLRVSGIAEDGEELVFEFGVVVGAVDRERDATGWLVLAVVPLLILTAVLYLKRRSAAQAEET